MQLEILTFCDAAAEYGGRLSILGATDTIVMRETPYRHPHCAVVCRFRVTRVEEGAHSVRLVIIDADGQTLVKLDGNIDVSLGNQLTGAINLIVNLSTIEFKQPGEYAIEVAVGGIQIGSSPLFLRQRHEATADEANASPLDNSEAQAG